MEEPNHKRFRKVGGVVSRETFYLGIGFRIRIIQLKIGCSVPVSGG